MSREEIPIMTNRLELEESVRSGWATDEELTEFFGPDLMNRLAAQWRGDEETRRLFGRWHDAVTEPIGVRHELAFGVFTGAITIEQFADALDDETLDRFLAEFPGRQERHQAYLERTGQV